MGPTTVCIAVETQCAARTRPLWLLPLLAPPPWSPSAALAAILANDSPGRSNWTFTGPPVNPARGFNVDVRLIWGKPRWWDETSAEAFRREANLSSAPVSALMKPTDSDSAVLKKMQKKEIPSARQQTAAQQLNQPLYRWQGRKKNTEMWRINYKNYLGDLDDSLSFSLRCWEKEEKTE